MRRTKGSRRIVVQNVEYRWRATGNDGYISIGIWPTNGVGPFVQANLDYHETWINNGDGSFSSAGDQIVITNKIIRRIIEQVIANHRYDPNAPGKEILLRAIDEVTNWSDAIRASKKPN